MVFCKFVEPDQVLNFSKLNWLEILSNLLNLVFCSFKEYS
ncbi:hypothetical protein JRYRANMO_CDS_0049 [Salmonella phage FM4b]|nr:hypothetical protein JRYRANMO_CDS_0049 [Salmonella phage FM4b]